jgi:hypothetical protein
MKKVLNVSTSAVCLLALATGAALAQSSGNFSAAGSAAACEIGDGGVLSGGITVLTLPVANISTSNGNGVTLDIRPSLVTGLFTKTKIDTSVSTASADVGIKVCVAVDGSGAGILPTDCVIYDQRFQQISSALFSQLAACQLVTSTICNATADCPTGGTCNIPAGATTGTCTAPNPLCNFDLILSTLSAHSFDFVVPVGIGKPHKITTSWKTVGAGTVGNSNVASCVGPGIVTVTQVKLFNNSGSLSF